MAITAYTGVPGSGKSYALVSQAILPALQSGRRVLSNVSGCSAEKFAQYAGKKPCVGEFVQFTGEEATKPGFWPTEDDPSGKVVRPGDLIVFDELRLTFPKRGALPTPDFEKFLRWHRHLVSEEGIATDVILCSQLIGDIHPDIRGLVERSYRFKKLTAVGLNKSFVYSAFEGSEQKAGTSYRDGRGRFRQEVFDLYSSYETEGDASEVATDKRASFFSPGKIIMLALPLLLMPIGAWQLWGFFNPEFESQDVVSAPAATDTTPSGSVRPQPVKSRYRIVGHVIGTGEPQVILGDDAGETRLVPARSFEWANGRPVRGMVDGEEVIARDRIIIKGDFDEEF